MPVSLRRRVAAGLALAYLPVAGFAFCLVAGFEAWRYSEDRAAAGRALAACVGARAVALGQAVLGADHEAAAFQLARLVEPAELLGADVYAADGRLFYSDYRLRDPAPSADPVAADLAPEEYPSGSPRFETLGYRRGTAWAYTAVLPNGSAVAGYIRVFADAGPVRLRFGAALLLCAALLAAAAAAAAAGADRRLRRLVEEPLSRLGRYASRLANGEVPSEESYPSADYAVVAAGLTSLAEERRRFADGLSEARRSLDEEVAQRAEIIAESRSLLESVLQTSQDGMMVLKIVRDADGRPADFEWILANPQVESTLSVPPGSLVGRRFATHRPAGLSDELLDDFRRVVETGWPLSKESYCDFLAGRGWYQISAVAIRAGIAVTLHDVTARKLQEVDLAKRANLDGLTGLANRGYFDRRFEEEWAACADEGRDLGLVFADVDFFKNYNDSYGHLVGDECLKRIAGVLAGCATRPRDLAARFGGEEFILLLPRTDAAGVRRLADRVHIELRALALLHRSSPTGPQVTISLGAAVAMPKADRSSSYFLGAADEALYQAKSQGRDRTVLVELD